MQIDLRSDTVTQPTEQMREAMAVAQVGDDHYGEDPTVRKLESMAAEAMEKEAGLFVNSGSMGNIVAILTHCSRWQQVFVGDKSHISLAEVYSCTGLSGIQVRCLTNQADGTIDPETIAEHLQTSSSRYPHPRLICLENTHNRCGGASIKPCYMAAVREVADRYPSVALHLDGARLFNAAIALRLSPAKLAECADSVTFCLSKGLAAPVGSVLCGAH
jgi:threonine aldolase